jgi:hypothetical protein
MAQKPLLVADGIPMPIVRLNRIVLVVGITAAIALNAPWITTILFAMIVPAVLFGRRASPLYAIGRRLLANQIVGAEHEDQQLMRFNNSIALVLLGAAQVAFVLGATTAGFVLAGMVAAAALAALLGFCLGCFLYLQLKLNTRRLFN